jgi:N-acetylglucosaminyldiphosphoundecaprenol N-acetyl-beta-D-mannosaminyltransferase
LKKKQILNTFISTGSYESFINHLFSLAKLKASSYVCVANVHMLIEGYKAPAFQQIINQADIATPDGMPLAKAMKWLYGIDQERVAGMDLMPDLMRECARHNLSIYLNGSTDEILAQIIEKASADFPELHICGAYSPPFRELSSEEKHSIIEKINKTNPDFVFVALGCPKQEKWMAEHRGKIKSCMIGLGGAFEVYAGVKDRAPLWMQKASLEWAYRLFQDPKRLWKRYLVTNTLFIIVLFKQWLKTKMGL